MNIRIILAVLFCITTLTAQTIQTVVVRGNELTDEDVIRRELLFAPGDSVHSDQLTESRNRLLNLNIFNDITFESAAGGTLIITVNEKFPIFPKAEFVTSDEQFAYGFSVTHNNVAGRNILVKTKLLFGDLEGGELTIFNPWFGGDAKLQYGIDISWFRKIDDQYDQAEFGRGEFTLSLGKRIDLISQYFTAAVAAGYEVYDYENAGDISLSASSDQYLTFALSMNYDDRDLTKFAMRGYALGGSMKLNALLSDWLQFPGDPGRYRGGESLTFLRSTVFLSAYHPLTDWFTIANNMTLNYNSDDVPFYLNHQFGENRYIRGNDNFGLNFGPIRFVSRNELRIRLVKDYSISIPVPFIGSYFKKMPTSLFGYVFADSGRLMTSFDQLTDGSGYQTGYGAGLAVTNPYIYRFSVEYGSDFKDYSDFKILLTAFF